MRRLALITLSVSAFLAACGSSPPAGSGAGSARPTLASEERRLAYLFRGTPVLITMQGDSAMRIEVPLRYCFDTGRSKVKPPLAAVLDRLASSQRSTGASWSVSASGDPSGAANLAMQRAAGVRDYLVTQGVASGRMAVSAMTTGAGVRIIVGAPPDG